MATSAVTNSWTTAVAILREQGAATRGVLHRNVAGLTHEESLRSPQPGGNCLNWVVGHMDCVNESMLGLLGQPAVLGEAAFARYQRGSKELHDPAEAMPLEKLLSAWDEQWARIDQGLAAMPPEKLDAPAPFSPRNKADETVGSLLTVIVFHQAYHTGQTALLRRMAGHEGAIR